MKIRSNSSYFWVWVLLLVLGCLGMPSPSRAQEAGRRRFVHWAYQDAASIRLKPRHGLYVLGGAALLGGVSLLDKGINHEVKEGYKGAVATYADITNELGGPAMTLPVLGVFTATLFTRNTRLQDAAFTSMEALAYSFVLNIGLKFAIGRVRPEDASGQHRFRPFSGHTSFPSGHANTVFAVLTPWALYYPHPVSFVLLFAAGGGTALARITREKHWFTDVVAGGLQGYVTALLLTRRHKRIQANTPGDVEVAAVPSIGRGVYSLTIKATF